MKTILLVAVLFLSCSENDPHPQISCDELKKEIELVNKEITEHHAKGSAGNPEAWENELNRLNNIKTVKTNEYAKRHCL
jgi:hypothetical protein